MITEQDARDAKDAREITIAILMAIAAILILAYGWPYIFGQVEVHQSVTTNAANTCQGLPNTCDETQTIKLNGLTVTEHITIHYCKETCHTYRLDDNGTIGKVN